MNYLFLLFFSDNFQGGSLATEHLIKRRTSKIAYLFGEQTHPQSVRQRYLSYLEALNKARLPFHTPLDDKSATIDTLMNYVNDHKVTAFVCENDLVAIQTMNYLKQHGYDIPNDFSVIGFDDIQAAALVDPPLTTVAQDFHKLGEIAGRSLIEWLHRQKRYPLIVVIQFHLSNDTQQRRCNMDIQQIDTRHGTANQPNFSNGNCQPYTGVPFE